MKSGDALVAIANEDIEALRLVGDIMEYNHRTTEDMFESFYEREKEAHDQTKERLAEAYAHIDLVNSRIDWLKGY